MLVLWKVQYAKKDILWKLLRNSLLSSTTAKPPPSPEPPPCIANLASGDTAWIRLNISSKSGNSISTPIVLDGAVRCKVAVSWKMGVENAEEAATWKPNNRIQKKLLPLPKEELEGEDEEDTISSIILSIVAVMWWIVSTFSVQLHRQPAVCMQAKHKGRRSAWWWCLFTFEFRVDPHFKNGELGVSQ